MLSKNLLGYPRQLVLTIHFIPEVAVCISKLQPNYLLVMTSLENAKKKFEVYLRKKIILHQGHLSKLITRLT